MVPSIKVHSCKTHIKAVVSCEGDTTIISFREANTFNIKPSWFGYLFPSRLVRACKSRVQTKQIHKSKHRQKVQAVNLLSLFNPNIENNPYVKRLIASAGCSLFDHFFFYLKTMLFVCLGYVCLTLKFADKRQKKKRRENKAEEICKGGNTFFFYTALYMTAFHVGEFRQAGASAGNLSSSCIITVYVWECAEYRQAHGLFFPFTLQFNQH